MKTIGLIGGMSWESTVSYYEQLNTAAKEKLGGLHSAKVLLYSVDFYEVERCMNTGDWDGAAHILIDAAKRLERGGADFVLIGTNTLHKVAPQVRQAVSIELLHIADAVADALLAKGIQRAALLGTRYTMEQDFYTARLTERGIAVTVPDEAERGWLNSTIFDELCLGVATDDAKRRMKALCERLYAEGAGGVILGCTELGMLITQGDTAAPLFDSVVLHAMAAAQRAFM